MYQETFYLHNKKITEKKEREKDNFQIENVQMELY